MVRAISLVVLILLLTGCQKSGKKAATDETETQPTALDSASSDIPIGDFDVLIRKLEDPERVNWQNPDMVLEKMGDITGKTIADIGVGTGYFAFRIIRRGGKVIGIDIEQRFLDYIRERRSDLPKEYARNIITRLTVPNDPNLRENEVDWVLIVNTFSILENRIDYLRKTRKGIKPGGKLLVVDFKMGDLPVGPENEEKIPLAAAVREIESSGFKIIETDNASLQYQYIIVAQK